MTLYYYETTNSSIDSLNTVREAPSAFSMTINFLSLYNRPQGIDYVNLNNDFLEKLQSPSIDGEIISTSYDFLKKTREC